jgi:hypothetical protein
MCSLYAAACCRMLTYAAVCCRMQMYAIMCPLYAVCLHLPQLLWRRAPATAPNVSPLYFHFIRL